MPISTQMKAHSEKKETKTVNEDRSVANSPPTFDSVVVGIFMGRTYRTLDENIVVVRIVMDIWTTKPKERALLQGIN